MAQSPGDTVLDIDGNVYRTVTIGTQVWMVENLKTTRLNDGTPLQLVPFPSVWRRTVDPAYCWRQNDSSYKEPFGALYNWHAVRTGKLAPPGWHVPTDEDWTILTSFLGGDSIAGGKLKEAGLTATPRRRPERPLHPQSPAGRAGRRIPRERGR